MDTAKRVFGLDLLRAGAITLVLLAHTLPWILELLGLGAWVPTRFVGGAGFLGVEIFFALSGFLIGGILLDLLERGASLREWRTFMVRRWMRTVPLYVVAIGVLAAVLPPEREPARHVLQYGLFLQNLAWPMPATNWFGVSWSLAIEEWFYLLFSATLFLLAARLPRAAFPVSCALFLLVPLVLRWLWLDPDWDEMVRRVAVLRLDAIATGVAFAGLWRRWQARIASVRWPLGILGAAGLALICFGAADAAQHPVGAVLIFNAASLATVLCLPLLAHRSDRVASPALRLVRAPVRWLSERSYGLYIVHLAVMQLALGALYRGILTDPEHVALLILAAPFAISELCFRLVERPMLARRPAHGARRPSTAQAAA